MIRKQHTQYYNTKFFNLSKYLFKRNFTEKKRQSFSPDAFLLMNKNQYPGF